jgi:hypothetical protein
MDLITRGAIVIGQLGTPIRVATFPSRAAARKFITTWGGRLLPAG